MKLKEQIKEKAVKAKNWVVENKGKVAIGAVGLLCGGLYLKHKLSNKDDIDTNTDEFTTLEEVDYGRDMEMQFKYTDTGELLEGSVPCTETYAKEMIEEFSEDEKEED